MAYVSRIGTIVDQGVAQGDIFEGTLVTINASGVRDELPSVRIAASGAYPVYVVLAAPDNFPRPVNSLNYTANRLAVIRGDVNTGWGDPVDRYTMYRQGISTLENPLLPSGIRVQLHRGDSTITLTSGNWIDTANIRVPNALLRVANDGTGRFELTTARSEAIGYVREYDAYRNYLTVVVL